MFTLEIPNIPMRVHNANDIITLTVIATIALGVGAIIVWVFSILWVMLCILCGFAIVWMVWDLFYTFLKNILKSLKRKSNKCLN